ncbi:hypothetical protein NA78x_001738 [Anatilimnocola sp. NA78]|uniref:hypothetical protein n=1 Tax=Anatilimnocola sp. NA78 TaxID=3415683 RepID=UPI003CE548C2
MDFSFVILEEFPEEPNTSLQADEVGYRHFVSKTGAGHKSRLAIGSLMRILEPWAMLKEFDSIGDRSPKIQHHICDIEYQSDNGCKLGWKRGHWRLPENLPGWARRTAEVVKIEGMQLWEIAGEKSIVERVWFPESGQVYPPSYLPEICSPTDPTYITTEFEQLFEQKRFNWFWLYFCGAISK